MNLLVLAKSPVAGRVKTRLCPPLTAVEAAEVALAALGDTLAAAQACGAAERVLALDGEVGDWLPPGWRVVPQRGKTFAHRLRAAWTDCGGPTLQIGMDTPQVTAALLDDAMTRLDEGDCVLGPANDGGWWALGLHAAEPHAFDGVPMSEAWTGERQLARLRELGLTPTLLPHLTDVDTWDEATAVADSMPGGQFGERVSQLRAVIAARPPLEWAG